MQDIKTGERPTAAPIPTYQTNVLFFAPSLATAVRVISVAEQRHIRLQGLVDTSLHCDGSAVTTQKQKLQWDPLLYRGCQVFTTVGPSYS